MKKINIKLGSWIIFLLGNRSLFQVEYLFETLFEPLWRHGYHCTKIQKGNWNFFIFLKIYRIGKREVRVQQRVKLSPYGDEKPSIKFFSQKILKKRWRTGNVPNMMVMKFGTLTHRLITPSVFFKIQNQNVRKKDFIKFSTFKSTNTWF